MSVILPLDRFSQQTPETDYFARGDLAGPQLLDLFAWSEEQFLKNTEGTAIRRIGHESWLRNIAVALGNCLASSPDNQNEITRALKERQQPSAMVQEHIDWALQQADSCDYG